MRCPHCDIALTHHWQREELALCHYCDYEIPAPHVCPAVQIRRDFATAAWAPKSSRPRFVPVSRSALAADGYRHDASSPGSHERALAAFRRGEVRILLGTQMIAKGLDFPDVTLVGVVNADTALHLPDFRAAERTFQLLVQVAGRTGRGAQGGRVLVQTFSPDHPAILAAVRHDYRRSPTASCRSASVLRYPPYSSMVRIIARGPERSRCNVSSRASPSDSRPN